MTNFSHKQLTRSAGRETGSTSDEENSRDIQILIWSHQNSCTCQKEDKLEDELVCQLAVDVYGHIGSIDDSFGFLGDSGGFKKVVMVKVIKKLSPPASSDKSHKQDVHHCIARSALEAASPRDKPFQVGYKIRLWTQNI